MDISKTTDVGRVARESGIPAHKVERTIQLLDEGNTIPFVTRYRRDQTGGLDEEQIRLIHECATRWRLLAERKQTILKSIESQGKLTPELAEQIERAESHKRLEDLYLPFKPRKQTLAETARQRGLEPFAREIMDAAPAAANLDTRAADFVSSDRKLNTVAEVLLGVGHLLAERFSERAELRERLRQIMQQTGRVVCSGAEGPPTPTVPDTTPDTRSTADRPAPERLDSEANEDSSEIISEIADAEVHPAATDRSEMRAWPDDADDSEDGSDPAHGDLAHGILEMGLFPNTALTTDAVALESSTPPTDCGAAPLELPGGTDGALDRDSFSAVSYLCAPEADVTAAGIDAAVTGTLTIDVVGGGPTLSEGPQSGVPPGQRTPRAPARDARPPRPPKARKTKKQIKRERLVSAFQDYFSFEESISRIPPHRILAINRGERARILRVKVSGDFDQMARDADHLAIPADHPHADFLRACLRDALQRLVVPSLEREIRRDLTDRAEEHAVLVFARNLRKLLLQPPVYGRRVLAFDPGLKSGCKIAAVDEFGNLLAHDLIFVVGKKERLQQDRRRLIEFIGRHQLSIIAIGNGTGCREAERFVADILGAELSQTNVEFVVVNEAGASVYSTSQVGREELPGYEAVVRGAVSIGRRLLDPLSELVKINPANIGVGMYQHDVKAKHLRDSLDSVVESCVNYVGVDVNTASPALLRYVSGLNQLTARRLYEHRLQHGPFRNREQFKGVPGFGEAAFVQAAGFLKIADGDNPLDATWIHPESYGTATRVLEKLGSKVQDLLPPSPTRRPVPSTPTHDGGSSTPRTLPLPFPDDDQATGDAPLSLFVLRATSHPGDSDSSAGPHAADADGSPPSDSTRQAGGSPPRDDSPQSDTPQSVTTESVTTESVTTESGASQAGIAAENGPVQAEVDPSSSPTAEMPAGDSVGGLAVNQAPSAEAMASVAAAAGGRGTTTGDGFAAKLRAQRSPIADRVMAVDPTKMAPELGVGELLLRDILGALMRPGRDPREDLTPPLFRRGIMKLEDLQPGMELTGTVLNVVDFGAFVDIGLSESGLVHISRLADRFIRDPHDVVGVGDVLPLWIVDVDKQRRRVSLTAIRPGTQRAVGERHERRPPEKRPPRPKAPAPQTAGEPNRSRHEDQKRARPPKFKGPMRPKPKPKPVTPITPEMAEGKEPLRSFSDLLQFYQKKQPDQDEGQQL